ncbi:hypothetical protein QHH03_03915, partial [Aphanizomenon sp. 202]|nr:hypothetical protein [Aphanizomenon sp. 202]
KLSNHHYSSNYPTLTLPDALGRELIFPVSPQSIGGIKGGNLTFVYTIALQRGERTIQFPPLDKGRVRVR